MRRAIAPAVIATPMNGSTAPEVLPHTTSPIYDISGGRATY
ncbi:hypothetical protein BH11ACT4_BH11ACT4_12690 [soil metagenome]